MDSEDTQSPSLVAPTDAISVDGSEVTFVWEPVEGVEKYRLQVGATARFEDLVVDADVGTETAVTVGNQLPTDGQTFFWRVLAESDRDERAASPVESFVATTAAEAEHEAPLPAADEDLITHLAHATQREDTTEALDLQDQLKKEKERGVAYEGVAARQIMGITGSIILVILVAVAIIFGWFDQVSQDMRQLTVADMDSQPIRQAEVEATQQLQQYGVVDKEEGVYRIPIDRAMDLVATEEYQQQQQPQ